MANYKRVLLKLSGESLAAGSGVGIDPQRLRDYAEQIGAASRSGVEVAIVIGGGNIFRGLSGATKGFDRVKGDEMGMLATVINSLALSSALEAQGVACEVFTSIGMEPIGRRFAKAQVVAALEAGAVAILAGGTGNPYFTTDTASALRGIEIGADLMLKGTRVDGVYTADPEKDAQAQKLADLTYDEVLSRGLRVMDLTAITLCKENGLPIYVFNMDVYGNLERALGGVPIGTLVHG